MTETETQNYKTTIPTREEFHKTYGGQIYKSDFNTVYENFGCIDDSSRLANRISTDRKFDMRCKTLAKNRDKKNLLKIYAIRYMRKRTMYEMGC